MHGVHPSFPTPEDNVIYYPARVPAHHNVRQLMFCGNIYDQPSNNVDTTLSRSANSADSDELESIGGASGLVQMCDSVQGVSLRFSANTCPGPIQTLQLWS